MTRIWNARTVARPIRPEVSTGSRLREGDAATLLDYRERAGETRLCAGRTGTRRPNTDYDVESRR
jgi:hypothetical protein